MANSRFGIFLPTLRKEPEIIEILGDRDLWSLLNGYGPNQRARSPRQMPIDEKMAYLFAKVEASTKDISASSRIRLVLEVETA